MCRTIDAADAAVDDDDAVHDDDEEEEQTEEQHVDDHSRPDMLTEERGDLIREVMEVQRAQLTASTTSASPTARPRSAACHPDTAGPGFEPQAS